MASRFPVSRWNLLALAAAVIGGSTTLAADQLMLWRWIGSGEHFPISERVEVEFKEGTHLIYYQSRTSVPVQGQARLYVFDLDGGASLAQPAGQTDSYHAHLSGWSGNGLWEVDIPVAGVYDLLCFNTSYLSDDDVPDDDRIVVDKHPELVEEVLENRTRLRYGGAFVTLLLVAGFYAQHIRTSGRSASGAAHPSNSEPAIGREDEIS